MNKKRLFLIVAGVGIILLMAFILFKDRSNSHRDISPLDNFDIQAFLEMMPDSTGTDSLDLFDGWTEHIKTVDEAVLPYLVPELCGYNPADLRMGVITVRRDIDPAVYAKAFPKHSMQPGKVDSVAGVYLYIQPMRVFPEGEYGRVAFVISNDSVIQLQFVRGGVEDMVRDVSSRLDAVSEQLEDLARQLENE